ncbi:PH domain-containing protein, partial [Streptomonospora sediminis]
MSTEAPGIGADARNGGGTEPDTAPGTAGWQRLSPLTMVPAAMVLAVFLVPAAAIGAVLTGLNGVFLPWGALTIAGGALGTAALTGTEALRWSRSRYRVTDERLEVRSGILVAERRSVPRDRIRSVDVSVPVWLRPFGLCSVAIGTGQNAGSGGGDVRLSYITRAEGGRLRGELLLRRTRPAGSGGGDDGGGFASGSSAHLPYTGRELARLRPVWFGFASASIATPLLGAGAVGTAFNVLSLFGRERANAAVAAAYHQFIAQPLAVLCGTAAAMLLIGAAAATAVQVEAWWGYRLDREPDGTLRLRRGLVTNTSLSLEERRLRGVELREPAPLRWVGGARVRAVATGLGSDAQNGGPVSRSALSPDMPRARALQLSADAAREPEPPTGAALRPHPGAALRRRITRALLGTAALAAAAAG